MRRHKFMGKFPAGTRVCVLVSLTSIRNGSTFGTSATLTIKNASHKDWQSYVAWMISVLGEVSAATGKEIFKEFIGPNLGRFRWYVLPDGRMEREWMGIYGRRNTSDLGLPGEIGARA